MVDQLLDALGAKGDVIIDVPPRKEFIVQGAYEIDADRIDA